MKRSRSLGITAVLCLAAAILAMPLTAGAQPKKDLKRAKTLFDQADKAFAQKNYRLAADQFAQSIAIAPQNPEAHYKKGMAHHFLKEEDQALSEFDQALKQNYGRPLDIYGVRWQIYAAQNNSESALADLKQAAALDPQNPQVLLALGDFGLSRGSNDSALDAYQKASLRLPNNPEPYLGIARVKYATGDAEGQLAAAQNALKRGTQSFPEATFLVGDALQKLGRQEEALDTYKKALTADVNRFEVYQSMGEIYRSQGRFDDAIDIIRKGLAAVNLKIEERTKNAAPPEELKVLNERAAAMYTDASWYYSLVDKPEDAVQSAQAAIHLQPNLALAHTNLCRAYNDLKKPEMALTQCNSALKIKPGDGETYFYLGRAYDLANRK